MYLCDNYIPFVTSMKGKRGYGQNAKTSAHSADAVVILKNETVGGRVEVENGGRSNDRWVDTCC